MNQFRTFYLILSIVTLFPAMATFGQDTTYTAPIGKIRKLVQIAVLAKECDSLVNFQEATIQAGIKLQAHTDSLLNARTQMLSLVRADLRDSTSLLKVYLGEEKRKRKSNGLWRNVFIGTTVILLYLLIKP